MSEPQTLDELIRERNRDAGGDDRLSELRAQIAREEGIPQFADRLHGGNATQIREDALSLRRELGLPYGSPTLASAIAAQQRAQAQRNSRMNH